MSFSFLRSWELCKRRLVNSLDFANLSYNQAPRGFVPRRFLEVPLGHEDLSNCTRVARDSTRNEENSKELKGTQRN